VGFRQLVNSSHKVGEAARQWLLVIVPLPQPSPDFRQDLRPAGCIFARQQRELSAHGFTRLYDFEHYPV